MVERSSAQLTTSAGGFDFARRLRDPALRTALRTIGWAPGADQHVVIAADEETVLDVVARIAFHETGGRSIIAITSDREPRHFGIISVEVAGEPGTGPTIELGPEASIGMLYDSLRPCGTFIPSEWIRMLSFERLSS